MKNLILTILFIVLLVLSYVWYQSSVTEEPLTQPELTGYVLSIDGERILVAEGLDEGYDSYSGSLEELLGSAVWLTITDETEIIDSEGNSVSSDSLNLNLEVMVYASGPWAMSHPAQGAAEKLVLTGNTYSDRVALYFSPCEVDESGQTSVIASVESNWNNLKAGITHETYGTWNSPEHYQFIGNNRLVINFNEGHIMFMGVIEFDCVDGNVSDVEFLVDDIGQPDGFPFADESSWNEVYETYGNESFTPVNYVSHDIVDGELVDFDGWTSVDRNVFVSN